MWCLLAWDEVMEVAGDGGGGGGVLRGAGCASCMHDCRTRCWFHWCTYASACNLTTRVLVVQC